MLRALGEREVNSVARRKLVGGNEGPEWLRKSACPYFAAANDEAVDILSAFRAVVRGVASTHGVRIAKWLGGGAMLVGVEPEPLLEALVEIEGLITDSGSPLPLRAGFTTGPVILIDGDDYVGHAVNLAARLCAAAEPRQVLAIADDIVHLYTDIVSVPAGRREIPGVEDPVDVVAIRR